MVVLSEIWSYICSACISPTFYTMVIQLAAPILLAALGCAVAAKANATNMGMEGIMTFSALCAVLVSGALGGEPKGGPWVGLVVAVVVGAILGFLVSVFAYRLQIDIVLVGISMNLICTGAAVFLMYLLTGDRTTTTSILSGRLPLVTIPVIKDIPIIGSILSGHFVLTYLSYILIFVLSFFLFKTKLGLRIRAVGENQEAAESVGISPVRIKTIALILSGAIGGVAGAYMSTCYLSNFSSGLIAGRGYVGLAACSMGSANPGVVGLCCIAFGIFYAYSAWATSSTILSTYALNALPYVVVVIGLVIYSIYTRKKEMDRLRGLDSEEKAEHSGDK